MQAKQILPDTNIFPRFSKMCAVLIQRYCFSLDFPRSFKLAFRKYQDLILSFPRFSKSSHNSSHNNSHHSSHNSSQNNSHDRSHNSSHNSSHNRSHNSSHNRTFKLDFKKYQDLLLSFPDFPKQSQQQSP